MFPMDRAKQPCRQPHAFFAWGCFRHFGLEQASLSSQTRKAPPFGRAFLALAQFRFELAILLRIGILALTARFLLLLARLLAAALLLARLLARVLILLA